MAHPQLASLGQLAAEVRALVSEALGRTVGDTENPSRETEKGWDSFTHVEIIFLLEDHFNLRFDGREIAGLQDVGKIVRLLETRLAA
jgi:acyl carrier protein